MKAKQNNQIGFKAVIIGLMTMITSVAHADEKTIQPFGPFKWDDGLWETIQAAKTLQGTETMELQYYEEKPTYPLSEIKDKRGLGKLLFQILSKNDAYFQGGGMKSNTESFQDVTGAVREFSRLNAIINIYPVMISGVPFNLVITLTPEPGFAIKNPDKIADDASHKYAMPFVITEVNVTSKAPSVPDKVAEINKGLYEKYHEFNDPEFETLQLFNGNIVGANLGDTSGHSMYIDSNERGIGINYRQSLDKFNEVYRKHIAGLQSKQTQNKPDMSSGL